MSNLPDVFASNPVTVPDVSSLIYLAEKVSSGPDVYADAGMRLDALFHRLLPRYAPDAGAVVIHSIMPYGTGQNSVNIGSYGGAYLNSVNLGHESRSLGVAAVVIGNLSRAEGADCISIGRESYGPIYEPGNVLIGAECRTTGFENDDNNLNLCNMLLADLANKRAGVGVRNFSDLTEDYSLQIGGELRSMAPVSGAAGNWRFGQFAAGNLRVTVDGIDYDIAAVAA